MLNSYFPFLCFLTIRNFRQLSTFAFQNQQLTSIVPNSWLDDGSSKSFLRATNATPSQSVSESENENKAMLFLKKIGKVGGNSNRDFRLAIGFDEGPGGKAVGDGMKEIRKASYAFRSCVESGVVDNMTEDFPRTSSGSRWDGFTDRSMGGISVGNLSREVHAGRISNVLRGKVILENDVGFIQMVTNLAKREQGAVSCNSVDASRYDGIEIDVYNGIESPTGSENFNLHLKTEKCNKPFSSFRASFCAPVKQWITVRVPFASFHGFGPAAVDLPLDKRSLTRIGIVASLRKLQTKSMVVDLAVAGVRFY